MGVYSRIPESEQMQTHVTVAMGDWIPTLAKKTRPVEENAPDFNPRDPRRIFAFPSFLQRYLGIILPPPMHKLPMVHQFSSSFNNTITSSSTVSITRSARISKTSRNSSISRTGTTRTNTTFRIKRKRTSRIDRAAQTARDTGPSRVSRTSGPARAAGTTRFTSDPDQPA
ncbi:hypothetical protein EV356DRAFT_520191 [Viridothelium virens]|uniref:Uncharacterized protein n=1 Tax=Viridothelium virens TaxID=1048519 RepID=A0A6A6GWF5_VIRVR|nr:hypothetical protein EV356DRAFT_520191 [Viridothelium virens]